MKTKNFFKWLCCSAILLIVSVQTMDAGTKRIYFKDQTWWSKDGAASAVHYWGGSATGTTWPGERMTKVSETSNIWYYDIPDNVGNFCFVRVNGSGTIADWDAKTGDLSFNSTNNLYTLSTTEAWSSTAAGGEWSKYAPNGAIIGSMNSWDPNTNPMSGDKVEIALSANTTYEFKYLGGTTYFGWGNTSGSQHTFTETSSKDCYDGNNNLKIKTTVAGTYIFKWNDPSNNNLKVYFPSTVTFDANGHGTAPASQVITYNEKASKPTDLSETGYTFGGWYENAECTGSQWIFSTAITANKTLYAKWTVNKHNLTWNLDGGTITEAGTAEGQVAYGTTLTAPTVEKIGYTFASWNPTVATTMPDNDVTYTATWTANTNTPYTVQHYQQNIADDGYTLFETENLTGTTGASVTPNTKTYTGFTAPSTTTVTIAADGFLVVKYNYTRNSHTLTWNADGGEITGTYTSGTVKYGASITAPVNANVTKDGFNFMGWMVNNEVVTPATTMPDNDLTYTAKWQSAATYSLTLVKGTGIESVSGGISDQTVLPIVSEISATAKTGYTFAQWTATGEGTVSYTSGSATSANATVSVSVGSVTLTASATPNNNTPYKVYHYQQNLADDDYTLVDTDNLTGTTDAQVTPDVKNYEGFTAPSAQTVTIAGDGSTTVTYNYTRNSYTLTWAGLEGATTQGGTPAGSVKYGATLTAPTLEKTGYNFTGWSPSVPATMPAANSTYTAQWEEILYTITLTNATATSVQAGIATHPSITANAAPVGQKFKQWNTTGGATVANATSATTTVSATAEGTIMAVYEDVPTVFFDNRELKWSDVYVHFNPYWDNDQTPSRGAGAKDKHTAHMTQIGTTGIYYYSYDTKDENAIVAFTEAEQSSYDNFHETKVAYREDFNECEPLFIPSTTKSNTFNNCDYFSDKYNVTGNWDTYSTTSKYYLLGLDDWDEKDELKLTKPDALSSTQTISFSLNANANYEFKFKTCRGTWYGVASATTITSASCTDIQFAAGNETSNCSINTTVAGTYTFTFDNNTKKLSVEYPAMPAPASITVTAERYFGEDKINDFIATDPAYKVYTDESIKLTIDAVAAPTGCTTYYQFGTHEASTERTYTITNPTTAADQSIEAKVFFRPNAGGEDGEAATETINYQGVAYPKLNLTASWNEKEENAVVDNQTVTITCSADDAAGVTATVTAEGYEAWNVTSYPSQKVYTLPDKSLHRYDFTATATVNGRTFTATTSVSVYRLVKITVTDPNGLMNHYYMWVQGSNPMQEEQAWPGSTFYSKLGNAHIFYVKYPSYTHFVLNDGKTGDGAKQTVDVALPDQSACYTIGTQVAEGDDKDKYQVNSGDCPNPLYVGDIADVSMFNGEGKLVQPEVDTDPDLDVANLNISVTFGTANIVTYDQRGTGFMLTALSRGTTTATVTYSIPGATDVVKNFNVTVGEAITIQAKIGTNLGWDSHENIWIKYWGTDGEHNTQMKFVKYVAGEDSHDASGQDYYTARLPMPDGSEKIRFKIGYPNGTSWDEAWRNSAEVPDVDKSGCYTVYYVAGDNANRGISRDGDNCFVDYQVEIDMISGITYFSNKVDNNTDIVSFFAPGSDKTGYEGGSVRIMKNGEQSASIPATTFTTSGIYTAKISGDGTGLAEVALYTGDYYIRTDAAADNDAALSTGWDDYKKPSHKFTQFSLYPDAKYNYYWVRNNKRTSDETHFNVKGTVGNEYNPDLANMISVNDYTDGNGDIVQDQTFGVNLRFGYNPQTNYFERAILKGAGDNYFLNIQGDNVYNDTECSAQVLNETNYNSHPEYSKFNDVSDWVYEKLIFVNITGSAPSAQVVLKSKSFNNKIMYQLGYGVDDHGRATKTPIQKVIMGSGTAQGKYALRVIYDYKTNRLSASWEPSGEIDKVMQVDADILFVSNEGNDVKEITFAGDSTSARLTSLQSVMYVLELENTYDPKTSAPDAQYWIALPFECKISDIFGIENYITLDENRIAQSGWWGIMRYRGDLRAQKGWFIEDTPEGFWEWMYPDETLEPGEGYVLYVEKSSLSWNSITVEEPCESGDDCQDGKKSVQKYVKRFYFPSLVEGFTMNKSTDASSKVTYPNQPCNITSPVDRRAEDSNWKVIAPKSYNNVSINSAEDQDKDHILEGPGFIYEYNELAAKGHRYTATATEDFEFKAFHGYMAQYGGTITWNPYSKTEHPTSAPYYGEEPSFKGGMLTIELVQNNEQLDRTFVNLSKNGTEGFDQNLDLTKITESCAQIASISEDVLYAGSTLPLDIELVPLNVKVTANGTYDIALEKSLKGLEVNLFDAFEQTTTPLDMMSATVTLNKGEYKDRFYLQLKQKGSDTPTSFDGMLEQYNLPTDKTQKLLINGNIYLINGGRIYNATGAALY